MRLETKKDAAARTVAELMRRDPVPIAPEASVFELARLLSRTGVHGVPVMESDGEVVGMASASDLLWVCDQLVGGAREETHSRVPADMTVRDLMTPDIFWVEPYTTVGALCRFFLRTGVHRALVMEDGALVGVVSLSDLLGLIAERKG